MIYNGHEGQTDKFCEQGRCRLAVGSVLISSSSVVLPEGELAALDAFVLMNSTLCDL